jgi:hypothetical protein
MFLGGGYEKESLEPAARAIYCRVALAFFGYFLFLCRPQLKESLNKFKGGALWLRELF